MTIWLGGDVHGMIDYNKLHTFPGTEDDIVIIAGDFGAYFGGFEDNKLVRKLADKPFTVLFVDGNHENFDIIDNAPNVPKYNGYVGKISDNIYRLHRGEVYTIEGKTFFTMGGGFSIDKPYRTEGRSWWAAEMPSWKEYDHAVGTMEKHPTVDYVISHTAPDEIKARIIKMPMDNIVGENQLNSFLQHVAETLTFSHWFMGHWHIDQDFQTNNGNYSVLYNRLVRLP